MREQASAGRLPRGVTAEEVDAAELFLVRSLEDGPRRPRHVKGLAAAICGYPLPEGAWQAAKRRLGVRATNHGSNVWTWALPAPDFEDDLAEWLGTAPGRFAVYYAERDRLALIPAGDQLELDV